MRPTSLHEPQIDSSVLRHVMSSVSLPCRCERFSNGSSCSYQGLLRYRLADTDRLLILQSEEHNCRSRGVRVPCLPLTSFNSSTLCYMGGKNPTTRRLACHKADTDRFKMATKRVHLSRSYGVRLILNRSIPRKFDLLLAHDDSCPVDLHLRVFL